VVYILGEKKYKKKLGLRGDKPLPGHYLKKGFFHRPRKSPNPDPALTLGGVTPGNCAWAM